MIPSGIVVGWSGEVANIPSGWLLCDGTNGTPDMRDRFIVGSAAAPSSGGTIVPTAALDHSAHAVTQPNNHSAHAVTQPNNHSAHAVTQPGNHSAHAVTQPNAHADVLNHTHRENRNSATTGGLDGWAAGDTSTSTPILTGYSTGNPEANGVASQAHTGTAVDAHSAHTGTAVDAHSVHVGTAVDAHSAHAGTAVDNHAVHGIYRYLAFAFIMKA